MIECYLLIVAVNHVLWILLLCYLFKIKKMAKKRSVYPGENGTAH